MGDKLKVVWLCQFANADINRYFGTNVPEHAPWITLLIELFSKSDVVELYIVAPNIFNNKNHKTTINGVHYWFYRHTISVPLSFTNRWRNIIKHQYDKYSNVYVRNPYRITREIGPSIIHLHGVEMPKHAACVIKLLGKYPVIASIAGFISLTDHPKKGWLKKQVDVELQLLRSCRNFGVRTERMIEYIKQLNSNAVFFAHRYPYKPSIVDRSVDGACYDFVFFSRVNKDKGIEDLIHAISILHRSKRDATLLVIGKPESSQYLNVLSNLSMSLGLSDHVFFTGFLQTQDEVHRMVSMCRVCVIPSYHDNIPGSIIESLYIGLPIVAYDSVGAEAINNSSDVIRIVPKGNVCKLADEMQRALDSCDLMTSEKAKSIAAEYNDLQAIMCEITSIYFDVVSIGDRE